MKEEK